MAKQKPKKDVKQKPSAKRLSTWYEEAGSSFRKNWKTMLISIFVVFLMFSMKMNEEWSSEAYGRQSDVNLYDVLGVKSSAPVEDIKKKYKKLLIENHPDKNPDCADCEEKMGKIQKAYEVLVNEDSRNHYDQTNGIMEPINSTTTSIYWHNFRELVLNTNRPWIIQVYSETSSNCQTFAGFWEEYAKEYNFLNFGRINDNSQKSLVNSLPFAVDELPTVISYAPGQDNEIFEFYDDRSPNAYFRTFVKKSLGVNYETYSLDKFKKAFKTNNSGDKTDVILVTKNTTPVMFQYMASYYREYLNSYQTKPSDKKKVQDFIKDEKATAVVIPPGRITDTKRVFTNGQNKNQLNAVLRYTHFLTVPGNLNRNLQTLV